MDMLLFSLIKGRIITGVHACAHAKMYMWKSEVVERILPLFYYSITTYLTACMNSKRD